MAKRSRNKVKEPARKVARAKVIQRVVGAVVMVFALIGLGTVIFLSYKGIVGAFDQSQDKRKYARLIAPLVALNPIEFETINDASPDVLREAAMWDLLRTEDNLKSDSDTGATLVPAATLDKYIGKLYGPTVEIPHASYGSDTAMITYNEETKTYSVPPMGFPNTYKPEVQKIKKSGQTLVLTVAYIGEENVWDYDEEGNITNDRIEKVMEYVLVKRENKYYIYSVRTPTEDTANTQSNGSDNQNSSVTGGAGEKG